MREIVRDSDLDTLKKEMREFSTKLLMEGLGHIVTVSVGALALLVTFRGALKGGATSLLWVLGACWVLLTLAVVAAVFCKMLASEAMARYAGPPERNVTAAGFVAWSESLAWVSSGAFALGVIALVVFGIASL